jgi:hypothetical protein
MHLEFLPAYSPDFNPIEQAFSKIKAYIRRHYPYFARSTTKGTEQLDAVEAYEVLLEAIYSVTPKDALGFFRHSGYL